LANSEGSGAITDNSLKTEKTLTRNDQPFLMIKEELKKITAAEYQQRRAQMLAGK
jgi:hypothetical protein